MKSVYIVYDCPWETCDKRWLYEGIAKEYAGDVYHLDAGFTVSVVSRKGISGRLKSIYETFRLCFLAWKKSSKGDIIIAWNSSAGCIINLILLLTGNRRKLVCMNWLTPAKRKFYTYYQRIEEWLCVQNRCVAIVTNSIESGEMWQKTLHTTRNPFNFVPDTYNDSIEFATPQVKTERYFFTGGMNNRDWRLVMCLAEHFPETKFVCVALESDFKNSVESIPSNVEVLYNTPSDRYYSLMRNSYAVLLPLKDSRVAGLINITMSAQYAVPCLISKTPAASMFYGSVVSDWLISSNDVSDWVSCVKDLVSLDDSAYMRKVSKFQQYIKETFNPFATAKKILDIALNL